MACPVPNEIGQILNYLKKKMPEMMKDKVTQSMYKEFDLTNPKIRLATDAEKKRANLQTWCADRGFEYPEDDDKEYGSNLLHMTLGSTMLAYQQKMSEHESHGS